MLLIQLIKLIVYFLYRIDIKKIIDKLKSKGSAGKDNIPPTLFKHLSPVISFPFSMIF